MQTEYTNVLALFVIHFSPQLWPLVQPLVAGAILVRGQRTVTAVLRVMGLSGEPFRQHGRAPQVVAILNNLVLGLLLRRKLKNVPEARRTYAAHISEAWQLITTSPT